MKYLFLAKSYNLVVGDKFELFYRGVIRLFNPYQYYILVRCEKGNPYPRYFTYTPKIGDVGCYALSIELIDNDGNTIEKQTTTLIVNAPVAPSKKLNILCIGDSLTVNGVWVKEGYRRASLLGFGDKLNFIGTCVTAEDDKKIGYEAYGGWTWKSYTTNDHIGLNSSVWIKALHNLTEADQHSIWKSNNHLWILETIKDGELKFKRGEGNVSMVSNLGEKFEHVENAKHEDDIIIESYTFEKTNPFWSEALNDIDLAAYVKNNNFATPDIIYILLTWNGLYIPYNHDFSHHLIPAHKLINHIHKVFPNALVRILGIQICSVNGGIASNYGASGPYSDTFGTISTAFYYNEELEKMTYEKNYESFVKYVDTKAQFDTEYNMPGSFEKVNARCEKTEFIGNNGVHPTTSGYLQIGDVFYRQLISDLKDL